MQGKLFAVHSIGKVFIGLTIVMVVVLFGGLGVFIAGQNAEALRGALKSKSSSVAKLASFTGADYLANFNFMALDHLVEDITRDPEVSFAGFYNTKQELVTKFPVPQSRDGLQIVEQQLKDEGNAVIGSLVIGYKQDAVKKSLYRSMTMVAAGTVIAIILFSLGISIASKRLILTPIKRLSALTAQVSAGDLSQTIAVTSHDEFGNLTSMLNGMIENLNQMVSQINKAAAALNHITEDLTGTSAKVVNAANLQAEGVSETSSAIVEINASIKGVAQNVELLALSAAESSSSILEMIANVSEVSLNTDTLSQSVLAVSSSIAQMTASIKQVESGVGSLQMIATSTASSVLQMDATIKEVEKNAANAAAISDAVRNDAELGRSAVEASIVGMKEIKRSSEITAEVINSLSQRTGDIGVILSVIDEVAEQTNLLALNAAIIAAQAGEHGKGFAVVADEIKELAERTRVSTQEITQVIKGVQSETSRAVEAIHLAERSIAEGKDLSEKSGEALTKIYDGVQQASQQMRAIARTTLEQSKGSQMIRDAMEQVSDMVDQIATATREQSLGSELILTATESMKQLTEQVRKSTHEQSKVGNVIAQSTENITDMIAQINRACEEQSHGSDKIAYAVDSIQSSASINVEATKAMDQVIANLFMQIAVLKHEMDIFKV